MKLKAISLHQPWASAMAIGLKSCETRHWQTWHTGLLAIHAAAVQSRDQRDFFAEHILRGHPCIKTKFQMNGLADFDNLPFGCIVAVGDLLECVRTDMISGLSAVEEKLGNYSSGRFGWMFERIWKLKEPFPVRGRQRIFNVDIPANFLPEEVLQKAKS